jgi:hypothetical protein
VLIFLLQFVLRHVCTLAALDALIQDDHSAMPVTSLSSSSGMVPARPTLPVECHSLLCESGRKMGIETAMVRSVCTAMHQKSFSMDLNRYKYSNVDTSSRAEQQVCI